MLFKAFKAFSISDRNSRLLLRSGFWLLHCWMKFLTNCAAQWLYSCAVKWNRARTRDRQWSVTLVLLCHQSCHLCRFVLSQLVCFSQMISGHGLDVAPMVSIAFPNRQFAIHVIDRRLGELGGMVESTSYLWNYRRAQALFI